MSFTDRDAGANELPAARERLERLLARRLLGLHRPHDAVEWAVYALEREVDAPSLRILAGLGPSADRGEIERYLDAAIREVGWEPPSPARLVAVHAAAIAAAVLSGELEPEEGPRRIETEILAPLGHPASLREWCYLDDGFLLEPYRRLEGASLTEAIRRKAEEVVERAERGELARRLAAEIRWPADGSASPWRGSLYYGVETVSPTKEDPMTDPSTVPPDVPEGERPHELTAADLTDRVTELLSQAEPSVYHRVLRSVAMRRPWRPEHRGWRNVKDQVLHVVYAAGIFLPVLAWPGYGTAALSGFLLGGLREWEQYRGQDLRILMFWDRLLDVTTFTLGAVLVFHFAR
ncbi:MAG TPA: hypothetical protein VLL48_09260 [Longimicrobiales bacterium]|nr:hypothetical protein [Longimicrobiales bacterium]